MSILTDSDFTKLEHRVTELENLVSERQAEKPAEGPRRYRLRGLEEIRKRRAWRHGVTITDLDVGNVVKNLPGEATRTDATRVMSDECFADYYEPIAQNERDARIEQLETELQLARDDRDEVQRQREKALLQRDAQMMRANTQKQRAEEAVAHLEERTRERDKERQRANAAEEQLKKERSSFASHCQRLRNDRDMVEAARCEPSRRLEQERQERAQAIEAARRDEREAIGAVCRRAWCETAADSHAERIVERIERRIRARGEG